MQTYYRENKLVTLKHKIKPDAENIKDELLSLFNDIDYIYSYVILVRYKNKNLYCYEIKYHISELDAYNTVSTKYAAENISLNIEKHRRLQKYETCIGFEQPSLDLMIQLFEPILRKLASEQSMRWSVLEYDDLYQIASISMIRLYKKGYYINKDLLRRAFINDVIMQLRVINRRPPSVSIETMICSKDKNELNLYNVLKDDSSEQELLDIEDNDEEEEICSYKRELIINEIGQRQYDQLVREYGNRSSTTWSRRVVDNLKRKFKLQGLTDENIRR